MDLQNQEHIEARQVEANKKQKELLDTTDDKNKKKLAAVNKACELLLEAEVDFYLFPLLPSTEYKGKNLVWQWNSFVHTAKYDNRGKLTPESTEANSKFHCRFFAAFFSTFASLFRGDDVMEKLGNLPQFFHHCMYEHQSYLGINEKPNE